MLAPSVSDMLKVLDKIPEWIGLKRLLNRVDELEKKVAALEEKLAVPAAKLGQETCPICEHGAMKTKSITDDPVFWQLGVKQRLLACTNCAHTETRQEKR